MVYVVIIVVVILKIKANPNYYITPDSKYYLEAAQNLLNGNGYTIFFEGKNTFCAIWPIGYSFLIATISFVTRTDVLVSSKIASLLAIGLIFWYLSQKYKEKSWFVALGFCASSFIQVYSNTWSETVFMMFLIGFCLELEQNKTAQSSLLFWAIAAFLTRYIGFFLLVPLIFNKKFKATLGLSVTIISYCFLNYSQTKTFTGGHGFWPEQPFFERVIIGLRGVIEEVLFFGVRDWDLKFFQNNITIKILIYVLGALQFLVLGNVIRLVYKSDFKTLINNKLISVAMTYLLAMILIYLTDNSIENLYFRRLAPFSILISIGFLSWLLQPQQHTLFLKTKTSILLFYFISILHAIPKGIIFE